MSVSRRELSAPSTRAAGRGPGGQEHGPFHEALRVAIANRGLTLDRLQHRLAARGHRVSTTSLSYWSHGRSQPERPDSIAALAALEEILQVSPGSLRSLLGEPRKRGRVKTSGVPVDRLWEDGDALTRVLRELDCPYDARRTISLHDRYRLDVVGAEAHCRVIAVMEATGDRVTRMFSIYRDDYGRGQVPTVVPVSGVRRGRIRSDAASGFTVTELYFDEVLNRGDRTIVEYDVQFLPGGRPTQSCDRRFADFMRQYLLEVSFAAEMLPARCHAFCAEAERERRVQELHLSAGNTARHVFSDLPPGSYGIEWEWPDLVPASGR